MSKRRRYVTDLRWECRDCGQTTTEAQGREADAYFKRMFGTLAGVPLREDGQGECPKCFSHNVTRYYHANLPADNASVGIVGNEAGSLPRVTSPGVCETTTGETLSLGGAHDAPQASGCACLRNERSGVCQARRCNCDCHVPVIRERHGCTRELCAAPLGPSQSCKLPRAHRGQHSTAVPEYTEPTLREVGVFTVQRQAEIVEDMHRTLQSEPVSAPNIPTDTETEDRYVGPALRPCDQTWRQGVHATRPIPSTGERDQRPKDTDKIREYRFEPGQGLCDDPPVQPDTPDTPVGGPTPRQPTHVRAREGCTCAMGSECQCYGLR